MPEPRAWAHGASRPAFQGETTLQRKHDTLSCGHLDPDASTHCSESSLIRTGVHSAVSLKLLPRKSYKGVGQFDPLRYYFWPILGSMYRRRVELSLAECKGGARVLEVGFGAGVTFLNLAEMYDEVYGLDLTVAVDDVTGIFAEKGVILHLRNGTVLDMPHPDETFDTVLLISILEHLRPSELSTAFREIRRVLRSGGQVVYGVPVERPLMVWAFRLLGHDVRQHHFSTPEDVRAAAEESLHPVKVIRMPGIPAFVGAVYEIGHFVKP
jgi:SAM-dependent methyltransferase